MICLNCSSETKNPKFCSRSCSVTFNNKLSPKKIAKAKFCKKCNNELPKSTQAQYCVGCKRCIIRHTDVTLKIAIYKQHGAWARYNLVRERARLVAKSLNWKSCSKCGYDKHIEIAHKNPISSFDEETLLSIINHPDNLLPLCPNCHWEFDNLRG